MSSANLKLERYLAYTHIPILSEYVSLNINSKEYEKIDGCNGSPYRTPLSILNGSPCFFPYV